MRLAPAFAVAALVLLASIMFWPKPNRPQALVYDQSFLTGKAMPVSAIYSEGDQLVVRDPKNGALLARAPGQTRRDAFFAISQARNIPLSQPREFVVVEDKPSIDLKLSKTGSGATIVMEDHPTTQENVQVIVFFSGEAPNLKNVILPANRPAYFVKIVDQGFLTELDSDHPPKKYMSPLNNKPQPINR